MSTSLSPWGPGSGRPADVTLIGTKTRDRARLRLGDLQAGLLPCYPFLGAQQLLFSSAPGSGSGFGVGLWFQAPSGVSSDPGPPEPISGAQQSIVAPVPGFGAGLRSDVEPRFRLLLGLKAYSVQARLLRPPALDQVATLLGSGRLPGSWLPAYPGPGLSQPPGWLLELGLKAYSVQARLLRPPTRDPGPAQPPGWPPEPGKAYSVQARYFGHPLWIMFRPSWVPAGFLASCLPRSWGRASLLAGSSSWA
ncbi:hypothetical protein BSL78_28309 [Apostichopus japonicus]|uniref:Uncharacterized protein n=1 Tax=Stichopus japonicus TaxID=307972 RepID=A0A2G8JGJ1_STIJA|nr:hypothetical protein BSL78_28309 [Apostichopus japonicus]